VIEVNTKPQLCFPTPHRTERERKFCPWFGVYSVTGSW